jgi:hypothetical protein
MITAEDLTRAEEILGHPLGRRKSDPQLAMAEVTGHLGLRSTQRNLFSRAAVRERLSSGVIAIGRRGSVLKAALAHVRQKRTWYLPVQDQVDQNGYPVCVAATGEMWEKCEPMRSYRGLGFMALSCLDRSPGGSCARDGRAKRLSSHPPVQ